MKFIVLTVGGMMLAGCSSPPPPPPVNWSDSAIEINSTMPDWKENNVVIPSPIITGHWAKAIYDFDEEKGHYLPDDYFAVTHANQIVVLTQTSEGYFNAKRWLRTHGAISCVGLLETIDLAKNATPSQRKINGKILAQDVQITATDVNAVTPEILRVEIPVGIPLPWPTEIPPVGWRICNGDSFDKKQYPLLALAYPSGKLPDLRGEFIRGWDAGRQVDNEDFL